MLIQLILFIFGVVKTPLLFLSLFVELQLPYSALLLLLCNVLQAYALIELHLLAYLLNLLVQFVFSVRLFLYLLVQLRQVFLELAQLCLEL